MVNVVFCTDGIFPYAVGGMQRHSRLLIEQLAKSPTISITVLHPHKENVFTDLPNVKEIRIEPIDTSKNYLLECYKYSQRVYGVLKELPQHVIYSQGLSVWYKASEFKNRLIVNPHGLEPYQSLTFKDWLIGVPFRYIFNSIFSKAKKVISLGGNLTSFLKRTSAGDKLVTIPNAVNVPAEVSERADDDSVLTFLFVARFAANKGIVVLMNAIEQLNNEGYSEKLRFLLAGKGPLYEEFKKRYRFPNIELLGFITDDQLTELYKEADVFVFPTLFEGMPTVVLEAMSYKLPVIVSDVGATAELVSSDNGFLIKANSVDELKAAIKKISSMSRSERKMLGEHSLRKVEDRFTWEKVAAMHMELFKEIQKGLSK
jgi:glycosyltransferase involved in cell wall biosynthesis